MNRRGFFGALSGLVAWAKKPVSVSPAASAIPPTCKMQCCACGASWHATSACPFNITAMGGVATVRFDGGTMEMAENFINTQNAKALRWASWGGQRVFLIWGSSPASYVAYAIPKSGYFDACKLPDPASTEAVVRFPLGMFDRGFLRSA